MLYRCKTTSMTFMVIQKQIMSNRKNLESKLVAIRSSTHFYQMRQFYNYYVYVLLLTNEPKKDWYGCNQTEIFPLGQKTQRKFPSCSNFQTEKPNFRKPEEMEEDLVTHLHIFTHICIQR